MNIAPVQNLSPLQQKTLLKQEVFSYAVVETVANTIFAFLSSYYTTRLGGLLLFSSAFYGIATNIALRSICAVAEYYSLKNKWKITPKMCVEVFDFASSFSTMFFGIQQNALYLIHEIGHATGARLFFRTNPIIILQPFKGAKTLYKIQQLSFLGQLLGHKISHIVTIIAGPLFSVLFTVFCVLSKEISEKKIRDSLNEKTFDSFHSLGVNATIGEIYTATRSIIFQQKGICSDYNTLWSKYQIHPLIVFSFLILSPVYLITILRKHLELEEIAQSQ